MKMASTQITAASSANNNACDEVIQPEPELWVELSIDCRRESFLIHLSSQSEMAFTHLRMRSATLSKNFVSVPFSASDSGIFSRGIRQVYLRSWIVRLIALSRSGVERLAGFAVLARSEAGGEV